MADEMSSRRRPGGPRAALLGLVFLVAGACAEGDRVGPSEGTETAVGGEVTTAAAALSGIVFSSSQLAVSQLNSTHTGLVFTSTPSNILSTLSQIRSKGGRVLLKLTGENAYKTNGRFDLAKWKAGMDRYRNINIDSYIADGTIVGHFILDEPHFPSRWGNQEIPQATVEEVAKYSKQRWPNLPTIVAAPANWLASVPVTYVALDAGWATFRSKTSSDPAAWIGQQVKRAKSKGLGLVAGLNLLDGGNGSSGIRGTQPNTWAMSAAEVKTYGSALLAQSYVCAFSMWRYDATYYNRTDVKNALADLSAKARAHVKTACKQ